MPRRGPPRLSIFTLKSATWRACGHALDLPRARSAAPLLQNLIVCCCCAIQAPRRPGLCSRGMRRRSIPRLDMLVEPFQPALCEREARHIHEIGACLITDCRPRMWQLNLTGKHDLFGPGSRALRVRFGCACQPGDRALCRAKRAAWSASKQQILLLSQRRTTFLRAVMVLCGVVELELANESLS